MNYLLNRTRDYLFRTVILCIGIIVIDPLYAASDNHLQQEYQQEIVPIFNQFCYSCHDEDIEESGLKLSGLDGKWIMPKR